jgi:RNA polymerase sigma-70 factor (ECF subfamily)
MSALPKAPMQRISKGAPLQESEACLHGLLLQGLAGDEQAYRRFLQASATHLRAFLRRRLSSWPDEVEDLVQESLLAIHNQRLTYRSDVPLTSWIYAIAKYKLIDWLRRHGRREQKNDAFDDEHELFSSAEADAGDARRDVATLLALLPEQQRTAIVHTKLDGWSVAETADALSISTGSVKVAVHRGMKKLAALLRNET